MEPEVHEVIPGLFLGGLSSLKYLKELGITHVLSVVNFPLQKDLSAYTTLHLPLQDSEASNILQYLPAAIKFLDTALGRTSTTTQPPQAPENRTAVPHSSHPHTSTSTTDPPDAASPSPSPRPEPSRPHKGLPPVRVLVHCQAGVSRSPAVVAGWLMRSRGLSPTEALTLLRSRRACVEPNEGFLAQLALFGDMRCRLDVDHPVYRMWCLEELASQMEEQGYVDPLVFGQLPEGPAGLSAALAAQQTLYRCRKCRQLLATSAHVVPVEAALGHRVFRDRQRQRRVVQPSGDDGGEGAGGGPAESCVFVAPMQWMSGTVTGCVAGKLHCPKCAARLGSFNWSGISNPAGAWVTPAFQLHLSKLDTVLPTPLEALANVRRPLVGPARTPVVPPSASDTANGVAAASPSADAATTMTSTAHSGPVAAPSLPATLTATVRRLGLGRAGPEEEDEEQLPEPELADQREDDPQEQGAEAAEAVGAARRGTEAAAAEATSCGAHSEAAAEHLREGAVANGCSGCGQQEQQQPLVVVTEGREGSDVGSSSVREGCSGGGDCTAAWFTHLILDCDGVLVDSEAASCEALRRAILEVTGFDIPHAFPDDYVEVFGMDVRSCVAHYRERFGRADWADPSDLAVSVQAAKERHYKELTEGGIPAFDGAERLIRRALAAGMQVGVASSGAPDKIARNLTSSGLAPLLPPHAVVSASQVAVGKPAPDVYLAAMAATGCRDPRRALVVEDAVNGLKAARAAGMWTVGITNQLPAAVLAPWADMVVEHLDQIDPAGLVPDKYKQQQQ